MFGELRAPARVDREYERPFRARTETVVRRLRGSGTGGNRVVAIGPANGVGLRFEILSPCVAHVYVVMVVERRIENAGRLVQVVRRQMPVDVQDVDALGRFRRRSE